MSRIAHALKRARRTGTSPNDPGEAAAPDPAGGPGAAAVEGEPWRFAPDGGERSAPGARRRRLSPDGGALTIPARRAVAVPLAGIEEDQAARREPPAEPSLLLYWDVVRRRWRTGLLLLLVVVSGVGAGSLLQTPVYRASALLEIRRDSATAVPVESLFSSEKLSSDDLETQYGILRSRTLAERVVAAVAQERAAPPVGKSGGVKQAVPSTAVVRAGVVPTAVSVDAFMAALRVNPYKGSRLVQVSYGSTDPRLAALTVNSVLDAYLHLRMEDADRSARWLEDQLAEAQRRLEDSERRLSTYIASRGLQAVETGKGEAAQYANERLEALHEALTGAQAERIARQADDEEARREAGGPAADGRVVQDLTVRLADLRREHAKLSATFKEDYPAVKVLNGQIAELERSLDQESRRAVERGQREYRAALRKESLLRQALDEQNAIVLALGADGPGRDGYQSLRRELVTNQEQFVSLGQKLQQVSVSAALKAANVGIVDRARLPSQPDGLPLPLALGLSAMVGLIAAVGGMFVHDHFDTSVRSAADVQAHLGIRPIGAIPAVGSRGLLGPSGAARVPSRYWRPRIDDLGDRQSPLGEAFAALRNAMLLQDAAADSRVLLVTSAQSEEGKTTVSINLALSLARLNYRVLLVDGNLRYPCIQRALSLPDKPGLTEYLSHGRDWRASLHRDVQANLDVLGGDEPRASPADLLSLPWLGQLFDAASREYDFVIVDSPAMLSHPADVHSLAAAVDHVLFTIRHGFTPRAAVKLALSQLDRVSGVVLNRLAGPGFASRPAGFSQAPPPPSS